MAVSFDPIFEATETHMKYVNGIDLYAPKIQYKLSGFRLPDSRDLSFFTRIFLLALLLVTFPCLGSIILSRSSSPSPRSSIPLSRSVDLGLLLLVLRDLSNEGLLRTTDKAVFIRNSDEDAIFHSNLLGETQADIISNSDSDQKRSVPSEAFDFAFAHETQFAEEFIGRTLKIGGIATVQLSDDPYALAFHKPSNYRIAYTRRFESVNFVAMKKMSHALTSERNRRKLCGIALKTKKAALEDLEDVLLEPPRISSRKHLKRAKYLPNLMADSLESYQRRVFIDVGLPEEGVSSWFRKYYPTRNLDFEMYKIETVTEESSGKKVAQIELSDWLEKNVKSEEFVVMKAEAEVVEEMVRSKAIRLVDELFLECKHQWQGKKGLKSKRAYWECLALYGRLRDEGVAVHQWWG